MSEPDVADVLTVWINDWHDTPGANIPLLRRARDEILALRDDMARARRVLDAQIGDEVIARSQAKARAEALEEAAQVCDVMLLAKEEDRDVARLCAHYIRALMDKR